MEEMIKRKENRPEKNGSEKNESGKKNTWKAKKSIATLLVAAGLAVAAICGVLLLSLAINTQALTVDGEDWVQDRDYGESNTLAWHMYSDMCDVIAYMGLQQMLEDQGTLNLERPALVVQLEDGSILLYTMADLVSLGEENGIYVYDEELANNDDVVYYAVTQPSAADEENPRVRVLWSITNREDAAVDLGKDVWEERQKRIDEAVDAVLKEEAPEYDFEDQTTILDRVEVFLNVYLANYYAYRRTWSQPGNLTYEIVLIQGDQTVVYQDAHTTQNGTPLHEEELWDMSYCYDSTTRRIETDMPNGTRDTAVQMLQRWSYCNYDSVSVAFGIDTDNLHVYRDAYTEEENSYTRYRSQVFWLVGMMAICALVVLVGMIWLMPLCGHRDGQEGIVLNLYDRIPTELGAAGIVLLGLGACLVIALGVDVLRWLMRDTVATDVQIWMLGGLAAALLALVYLMLWLGFYGVIRRGKAHTLWRNSLCGYVLHWCLKPLGWCRDGLRWCGAKMKKVWTALLENGDVTWKTAVVFVGYLLIHLVLLTLYYSSWDGIFVLLILAFNVLVGAYLILKSAQRKRIWQGVTQLAGGHLEHHLPLNDLTGEEKKLAEQINRIGDGLKSAVEESLKNERMKTELITNVSHDIKTPLTSIINYVDLLKREHIEDPKIQGYIQVLEQKSQRLKTLTEDLVEASKASSGTLQLSLEKIDFVELIHQTTGEFSDRFAAGNLALVTSIPETPSYIMADGRYVWRILENLYRNAEKYSMPGTRVYIEVFEKVGRVFFVMKNVSNAPLNIKAEELTERFIRGDVSRTTEGSGLGLSIAKDMTELMNGTFRIHLDGDLFRVTVSFALIPEENF